MIGFSMFVLLIITAGIPSIAAYFQFCRNHGKAKFPLTPAWFFAALLAGTASLAIASFAQVFFKPQNPGGLWPLFFSVFVRAAIVEEASRIFALVPLVKIAGERKNFGFAASIGLVSGIGFAAAENAIYGIAGIDLTLLRIFTAAPVHAACSARIGAAVFLLQFNRRRSFFFLTSAVAIHGVYNLIILSPAISSLFAVPAAFIAFFASFPLTKAENDE